MATTGTGTSTTIPSVTAGTLGAVVSSARSRLDDVLAPYLWSNDELTEYIDYLQKSVVREMFPIEDRTTSSICSVALVQADETITIDPRILRVMRAHLASQTQYMDIVDTLYMDAYHPGWDHGDTDQAVPRKFVYAGLAPGTARIWPPLLAATDTLNMVVLRMPLVTLDYSTHSASTLETAEYQHLYINGIMWQAYLKQDADAYDPKKAEQHRILWEGKDGHSGDKERIRIMNLKKRNSPTSTGVMQAFT